jgi:hypothetical protein
MSVFITRTLLILFIGTVMTGCKFALMVTADGDVSSSSGTRDCAGGTICEFEITDTDFSDTFTATAREGYVFSKWQAGDGYLCANSPNAVCAVSNVPAAGIPVVDVLILSGTYFYARPVFTFVGLDTDGDGVKNHLDEDDDNDGVLDPDDNCPLDGPNVDGFGCPFLSKTVFVTSESYTGNLGGLAGADQKCNDLAAAASLAGDYKAWLSDSSESPNTRFTQFPGPYKMVNGTVIASDFADVVDGALNTVIDRDEHGAPLSSFTSFPFVWTSTKPDGSGREDRHCVDWTNDVPGQAPGILGGGGIFADEFGTTASPIERWTYIGSTTCAIAAHLYCFQQ